MSRIIGSGNIMIDIFAYVDGGLLLDYNLHRGKTYRTNSLKIDEILSRLDDYKVMVGGGSLNTVRLLSSLRFDTGFTGCVGVDEFGKKVGKVLSGNKIEASLQLGKSPTGRCLYLIDKDDKHNEESITVVTDIGANIEISFDKIKGGIFRKYDVLITEGYLLHNHFYLESILETAKSNNLTVCFDLSHRAVVEKNRDFIFKIIKKYVDILFLNEEELVALTETDLKHGSDFMKKLTSLLVIKRGAQGGMVIDYGFNPGIEKIYHYEALDVPVKNTIGAGDTFAAFFLAELIRSKSIEKAVKFGNLSASMIVQNEGSKLNLFQRLKLKWLYRRSKRK